MKTSSMLKHSLFIAVAACTISLTSCLDDDDNSDYRLRYPNALVTVKTDTDNTLYLQLDDNTTLLPTNLTSSLFGGKEVRALVNYDETTDNTDRYSQSVHVNWIDSIRTKPLAPNLGEENDEIYGTDPVEIVKDWVTIAEDGYLTLRFRTLWGNRDKTHFVNLLPSPTADNAYEVEFRHHANNDVHGQPGDALVAFRLDNLPDTEGKTVKLKLKWKSFSGDKSAEFDYCTRKAVTPQSPTALTDLRNNRNLQ